MSIKLFPHQIEQVEQGKKGKNINQSEVGTGKSLVGLTLFKESKFNKLLIICLASKVSDFQEDGLTIGLEVTPLNKGTTKNKELLKGSKAVSISFESSWRLVELMKWVDSDTMVLIDESHKVKSTTSKVGMFINKLAKKAGYVYLMSATMFSNGKFEDLWNQLSIAGVYTGTFKQFKERYCIEELQEMKVRGKTKYFNAIVGYQNTNELLELLKEHSVFKARDIDDSLLPEDIFYYTKKPTMYNKLLNKRVLQFPSGEIVEYDNLPMLRHALLQLCSGVLAGIDKPLRKDKLERTAQILEEHNNQRVVIFYNYNIEKDMLIDLLTDLGRNWSLYNGESHNLDEFKNNENGVVLAQYKSASTGINDFVISHVCIFFSTCDSSSTYIQAKGRLNRHGQTKKPIYYHLIADKSVEYKVYHEYVQQGKELTDKILESLL